jgi:hypothetical protein
MMMLIVVVVMVVGEVPNVDWGTGGSVFGVLDTGCDEVFGGVAD